MKIVCDCGNELELSSMQDIRNSDFSIVKYEGEQLYISCDKCNDCVDIFVIESID